MSHLSTLSALPDPGNHADYWADDRVLVANELVRKLTPEDWDRLPDALDAAPADRAVPILLPLLQAIAAGSRLHGILIDALLGDGPAALPQRPA